MSWTQSVWLYEYKGSASETGYYGYNIKCDQFIMIFIRRCWRFRFEWDRIYTSDNWKIKSYWNII